MQKVTMEDIENIKCLSEVSFSPDGKAAAFVETAASVKENRYLSNIWVFPELLTLPRTLNLSSSVARLASASDSYRNSTFLLVHALF